MLVDPHRKAYLMNTLQRVVTWKKGDASVDQNGALQPSISIIIAVLNAPVPLQNTFESLRDQKREYCELIVLDGGSSDSTVKIIENNSDIINWWSSETDDGIYNAWNKALVQACGKWIIFLGAGDRIGPGWLEAVKQCSEEFDLVYGNVIMEASYLRCVRHFTLHGVNWNKAKVRLSTQMSVPHVGLAHHRRLFYERGFDASYKIIGDWEFLLRANPPHGLHLDRIQAIMPFGGKSNSGMLARAHYAEIRRALECYGYTLSLGAKLKWRLKLALGPMSSMFQLLQIIYWNCYRSRVS
jgi:glycosyltransferase involved in cell wall biosynthesis